MMSVRNIVYPAAVLFFTVNNLILFIRRACFTSVSHNNESSYCLQLYKTHHYNNILYAQVCDYKVSDDTIYCFSYCFIDFGTAFELYILFTLIEIKFKY